MNAVLEQLHKIGIVPVVVLDDVKDTRPLAKALCDGGLPCAEVTFRTDAAEEAIRIMCDEFPEMLVGAGTVLTIDQADRAIAVGAKFIVSPGLDPELVRHCQAKHVAVTPGVVTPGEVTKAANMGLDVVKFFPAEPSGGLPMIQALASVFTKLFFMPTGGINLKNVGAYLEDSRIWACGGSWMVKGSLIRSGAFDEIENMTREAAALVHAIRG